MGVPLVTVVMCGTNTRTALEAAAPASPAASPAMADPTVGSLTASDAARIVPPAMGGGGSDGALLQLDAAASSTPPLDAAVPTTPPTDAAAPPTSTSDAGACALLAYRPQLVCLGTAAGDYAKYLMPDAGVGMGQCPAMGAFRSKPGEGACGYAVCGPLQPSAIPADAGLDGGSSCCFWVVPVCGI